MLALATGFTVQGVAVALDHFGHPAMLNKVTGSPWFTAASQGRRLSSVGGRYGARTAITSAVDFAIAGDREKALAQVDKAAGTARAFLGGLSKAELETIRGTSEGTLLKPKMTRAEKKALGRQTELDANKEILKGKVEKLARAAHEYNNLKEKAGISTETANRWQIRRATQAHRKGAADHVMGRMDDGTLVRSLLKDDFLSPGEKSRLDPLIAKNELVGVLDKFRSLEPEGPVRAKPGEPLWEFGTLDEAKRNRLVAAREAELRYQKAHDMFADTTSPLHSANIRKALGQTISDSSPWGRFLENTALRFGAASVVKSAYDLVTAKGKPIDPGVLRNLDTFSRVGEISGTFGTLPTRLNYLRSIRELSKFGNPEANSLTKVEVSKYLTKRKSRMAAVERFWAAGERLVPDWKTEKVRQTEQEYAQKVRDKQPEDLIEPKQGVTRFITIKHDAATARLAELRKTLEPGTTRDAARAAAKSEAEANFGARDRLNDYAALSTSVRYVGLAGVGLAAHTMPLWVAGIVLYHGAVSIPTWIRAFYGRGEFHGWDMRPKGLNEGGGGLVGGKVVRKMLNMTPLDELEVPGPAGPVEKPGAGAFGGRYLGRKYNAALDSVPDSWGQAGAKVANKAVEMLPGPLRTVRRSTNLFDTLKLKESAQDAANRKQRIHVATAFLAPAAILWNGLHQSHKTPTTNPAGPPAPTGSGTPPTGNSPGTNPGAAPGGTPGTGPGTTPGTGPGSPSGTPPGSTPGTAPGTTPGTGPGTTPGTSPGTTPGTGPGTTPGTSPGTTPGTQPTPPTTSPPPTGQPTPGTPAPPVAPPPPEDEFVIVDGRVRGRATFWGIAESVAERDHTDIDTALDKLYRLNPQYKRELADGVLSNKAGDPDLLYNGNRINTGAPSVARNSQPAPNPTEPNEPSTPSAPSAQPPREEVYVTVDDSVRERSTFTDIALAKSRRDHMTFNQALDQLFNLNPHYNRAQMDGILTNRLDDPDSLNDGTRINTGVPVEEKP